MTGCSFDRALPFFLSALKFKEQVKLIKSPLSWLVTDQKKKKNHTTQGSAWCFYYLKASKLHNTFTFVCSIGQNASTTK